MVITTPTIAIIFAPGRAGKPHASAAVARVVRKMMPMALSPLPIAITLAARRRLVPLLGKTVGLFWMGVEVH